MSIIHLIIFTLFGGICTIVFTRYKAKNEKSSILKQLFNTVLSFNTIWYTGILIQYFREIHLITEFILLDFLLSSCLFVCRLFFLFFFYSLVEKTTNQSFIKSLVKPFRISILIIISCWILAWIEPLTQSTKNIVEPLMIYTDILIFGLVLGGSVFLFYQAKQRKFIAYSRELKYLGFAFFIPMILAVVKWMLSNTGIMINSAIERTTIHIFVLLNNILVFIWVLIFGKKIKGIEQLRTMNNNDEFIIQYGISKREIEIIELISEGKTNQIIADSLYISIETVKDHNSNIYLKTGVNNRTQLAKLYLDSRESNIQ